MRINDDFSLMKGRITAHWFNPVTGEHLAPFMHSNTLSYACADVIANLMAGNSAYAPQYMGFIYGTDATAVTLSDPTLRTQSWSLLATDLATVTLANIQISPLTLAPTVAVDGDASLYTGNSTIYTAHTRSGASATYGFPLTTYAPPLADGNYLYHAMLLTKLPNSNGVYIPVARATLESGSYFAKPAGFEIAIDWQVSFF